MWVNCRRAGKKICCVGLSQVFYFFYFFYCHAKLAICWIALYPKLSNICFAPKWKKTKKQQLTRRLFTQTTFDDSWRFGSYGPQGCVATFERNLCGSQVRPPLFWAKLPHLVACHQLLILSVRRQSDYTLVISAVVIPWFNTHRAPLKSNIPSLAVWPNAAPSKSIKDVEAQSVFGALSLKINMLAEGKAKQATCDILMASSVVKSPMLNPFSNLYFSTQRSTHANRAI